eukprot:g2314.t1
MEDAEMEDAEMRIDASDGIAYTKAEFIEIYEGTDEWDEAEVAVVSDGTNEEINDEEKRIDLNDGEEYTKSEFIELYGGVVEWDNAKKKKASKKKREVNKEREVEGEENETATKSLGKVKFKVDEEKIMESSPEENININLPDENISMSSQDGNNSVKKEQSFNKVEPLKVMTLKAPGVKNLETPPGTPHERIPTHDDAAAQKMREAKEKAKNMKIQKRKHIISLRRKANFVRNLLSLRHREKDTGQSKVSEENVDKDRAKDTLIKLPSSALMKNVESVVPTVLPPPPPSQPPISLKSTEPYNFITNIVRERLEPHFLFISEQHSSPFDPPGTVPGEFVPLIFDQKHGKWPLTVVQQEKMAKMIKAHGENFTFEQTLELLNHVLQHSESDKDVNTEEMSEDVNMLVDKILKDTRDSKSESLDGETMKNAGSNKLVEAAKEAERRMKLEVDDYSKRFEELVTQIGQEKAKKVAHDEYLELLSERRAQISEDSRKYWEAKLAKAVAEIASTKEELKIAQTDQSEIALRHQKATHRRKRENEKNAKWKERKEKQLEALAEREQIVQSEWEAKESQWKATLQSLEQGIQKKEAEAMAEVARYECKVWNSRCNEVMQVAKTRIEKERNQLEQVIENQREILANVAKKYQNLEKNEEKEVEIKTRHLRQLAKSQLEDHSKERMQFEKKLCELERKLRIARNAEIAELEVGNKWRNKANNAITVLEKIKTLGNVGKIDFEEKFDSGSNLGEEWKEEEHIENVTSAAEDVIRGEEGPKDEEGKTIEELKKEVFEEAKTNTKSGEMWHGSASMHQVAVENHSKQAKAHKQAFFEYSRNHSNVLTDIAKLMKEAAALKTRIHNGHAHHASLQSEAAFYLHKALQENDISSLQKQKLKNMALEKKLEAGMKKEALKDVQKKVDHLLKEIDAKQKFAEREHNAARIASARAEAEEEITNHHSEMLAMTPVSHDANEVIQLKSTLSQLDQYDMKKKFNKV